MKRITKVMLTAVFLFLCLFSTTYATTSEDSKDTLKNEKSESSTHVILEMKKHEEATIENLSEDYGSHTYGVTAYILNRIRIFSIPCVFLGIAFSAIHQYVIGLKRLDVRDKGFNSMIAIITIGIICQILPIIFAIVVTREGN